MKQLKSILVYLRDLSLMLNACLRNYEYRKGDRYRAFIDYHNMISRDLFILGIEFKQKKTYEDAKMNI